MTATIPFDAILLVAGILALWLVAGLALSMLFGKVAKYSGARRVDSFADDHSYRERLGVASEDYAAFNRKRDLRVQRAMRRYGKSA